MAKKRAAVTSEGLSTFDLVSSRSQWMKGVLEICLLSVISCGEAYGYEIAQQLEAAGLGVVKGGTLYPRLAALDKAGLVTVDWRPGDSGPGRKYYRVTPKGLLVLEESRIEYQRFSAAVGCLLAGDGGQANGSGPASPEIRNKMEQAE